MGSGASDWVTPVTAAYRYAGGMTEEQFHIEVSSRSLLENELEDELRENVALDRDFHPATTLGQIFTWYFESTDIHLGKVIVEIADAGGEVWNEVDATADADGLIRWVHRGQWAEVSLDGLARLGSRGYYAGQMAKIRFSAYRPRGNGFQATFETFAAALPMVQLAWTIIANVLAGAEAVRLAKVGIDRLAESVVHPMEILDSYAAQWSGQDGAPQSVFDLLKRGSVSLADQAQLLGISEAEATELSRWVTHQPFTPEFIERFGYLINEPDKFVTFYAAHGLGLLAAEEYTQDVIPIDTQRMYRCQCPKNCGAMLGVDPIPSGAALTPDPQPDIKLGFDRQVDHFVTTRARLWKILLGQP